MNQSEEVSAELALNDNLGWHMRPAGLLVAVANMFESEIMVKCGRRIASAKSLLGVLTLGAGRGARFYVSARGRDAQMAIKAIKDKFSSDPNSGVKPCSTLSSREEQENRIDMSNKKEERMKDKLPITKKTSVKSHVPTTFKCGAKPETKSVFLAGDFNGWDPQAEPMTKRGGQFTKSVKLAPGKYQYKFVIDGEWHADPTSPMEVGPLGSANNVICV